jgi:hypothetical protein
MRVVATLLFWLLIVSSSNAQVRDIKNLIPDYAQLQFAGNMGLLSAGVGYDLAKDKLHISLLDGFTPASIAGSNINTINLRGAYDIVNIKVLKRDLTPYIGLTVSFETSGNAFYSKLPDRYSDGYYKYSAIHLLGFAGAKYPVVMSGKGKKLSVYAEMGTVDSYVYYYMLNTEQNFGDMFSAALGIIYHF